MDSFEFDVDEKIRPSVERKLTGTTQSDSTIASLPISSCSVVSKLAIIFLRLYRKVTPAVIRNRCVFEPSCSHYSELAIRQHGLLKGTILSIKRLNRCKPGEGGVDFHNLNQGK